MDQLTPSQMHTSSWQKSSACNIAPKWRHIQGHPHGLIMGSSGCGLGCGCVVDVPNHVVRRFKNISIIHINQCQWDIQVWLLRHGIH